tara:strand:- start:1862 stop:2947 length:1086 start_codon:yes stop_codon:yes gene_type:complete
MLLSPLVCYSGIWSHGEPITVQQFNFKSQSLQPDPNGWIHYLGFSYKGPVTDGRADGIGLCKGAAGGIVSQCKFESGMRTDADYVQSRKDAMANIAAEREEAARRKREAAYAEERRKREQSERNAAAFMGGLQTLSAGLQQSNYEANLLQAQQNARMAAARASDEEYARSKADAEQRQTQSSYDSYQNSDTRNSPANATQQFPSAGTLAATSTTSKPTPTPKSSSTNTTPAPAPYKAPASMDGPGNGYTGWSLYSNEYASWNKNARVDVYYATRADKDEIRVIWKCDNRSNEQIACSIGTANANKSYTCYKGGHVVGTTGSLGERGAVAPLGDKVFPSDWACRKLGGADSLVPKVNVGIDR